MNKYEQDAFTAWRRVLYWQRGELKKIKRGANRRERRSVKQKLRNSVEEW